MQVEEARHRLLAVDQVVVHVDVEDVGAALDLLAGHGQRRLEVAVLDQAGELREPVMLVRSPTMTKLVSGRTTSASVPL